MSKTQKDGILKKEKTSKEHKVKRSQEQLKLWEVEKGEYIYPKKENDNEY